MPAINGILASIFPQVDYLARGGPNMNEEVPILQEGESSDAILAALMEMMQNPPQAEISGGERLFKSLAGAASTFANVRGRTGPGRDYLGELRDRRQGALDREQRGKVAGMSAKFDQARDKESEATRVKENRENRAFEVKRDMAGDARQDAQIAGATAIRAQERIEDRQATLDEIDARQKARIAEMDAREATLINDKEDEANAAVGFIIQDLFEVNGVNPPLVTAETSYEDAMTMFKRRIRTIPKVNIKLAMIDFIEELDALGIEEQEEQTVIAPSRGGGGSGVGGSVNAFVERLLGTDPQADTTLPIDNEKAAHFRRIADILAAAQK